MSTNLVDCIHRRAHFKQALDLLQVTFSSRRNKLRPKRLREKCHNKVRPQCRNKIRPKRLREKLTALSFPL